MIWIEYVDTLVGRRGRIMGWVKANECLFVFCRCAGMPGGEIEVDSAAVRPWLWLETTFCCQRCRSTVHTSLVRGFQGCVRPPRDCVHSASTFRARRPTIGEFLQSATQGRFNTALKGHRCARAAILVAFVARESVARVALSHPTLSKLSSL